MRSNIRSWSLVVGALLILAACILSYILTQPADADVAKIHVLPTLISAMSA